VHPSWLSHKEKRPWLEISMGGQPWPELELHGRLWECSLERGERGKESGRRGEGAAGGARGAVGGGGCYGGKLRPGCSSVPSMLLA
jgi:hypothetical protein